MKYFSPAEASRTLPLVRKIVADILKTGQELRTFVAEAGDSSETKSKSQELDSLFS